MLTFKKLSRDSGAANGTSLQGQVEASYDELVQAFGQPTFGSGDGKTQASWVLSFDGLIATIYDWKENVGPKEVTDWHVGGKSVNAAVLVQQVLNDL